MRYGEAEMRRSCHVAFKLAQSRRRQVTSVDKANVLDCSRLWREVVTRIAQQYADVQLRHTYVDSAAMALVSHPTALSVLLRRTFGDMLMTAGAIVGSSESWDRRVSAAQWGSTNRCTAPPPILPEKALPILWERFFQSR